MKVLFVSNDPTIFNPESATRARMREYAAAIGTLHIISRAPKGTREQSDGALTVHPIVVSKLFAPFMLARKAHTLILREGIEVVSAQDPFEQGWAAAKAVRGTAAKLHIQIHTDFLSPWFVRSGVFRSMRIHMPYLNRFRLRIAKKVLPQASAVRAVSKRVRDSVVATYGATVPEPSVIPISVGREVPEAVALPAHNFSFAFMCSGRLEPEKRVEDILMALGRIAHSYPSVGLVIVGEGSERKKLEKLSAKLGLATRVLFMGEQGKDAWGLMKSANVFVQASAYEGYGRTLIEAALAKVPIITTDVGIVGEVLKGYEQVLATPPADTANMASHMHALIGDHQLRLTLALAAEQAAREHLAPYSNLPGLIAADLARTLKTR